MSFTEADIAVIIKKLRRVGCNQQPIWYFSPPTKEYYIKKFKKLYAAHRHQRPIYNQALHDALRNRNKK